MINNMKLLIEDVKKAEYFQIIFQNIKVFSDIFSIDFTEDGIYIQGLDNSHIVIFEVKLSKDWFSEYEITTNESLGVHGGIISKVFNTRDNIQHILMETHDDTIDLSFIHPSTSFNKHFRIPLVDFDSEKMTIPETDYDVSMEIDSKEWKKIIDQLSAFGDSVGFSCNENEFKMITETTEGKMNVSIESSKMEEYTVSEECNVNSSFQIKFLQTMTNFHKINKKIVIMLSKGMPCCCRYKINEERLIRFYLAPQLDN